jgi:3-hydroxyacyl-[acyl-carrier-protein] dehydratase
MVQSIPTNQLIQTILPHRYPFLLLDRVLDIEHKEFARGLKNVSYNEPFFQGHFPGHPVMPGVLLIEGMAQLSALIAYQHVLEKNGWVEGDKHDHVNGYLLSIDNAKFRHLVVPGDQVIYESRLTKNKRNIFIFECRAMVGDKMAARAKIGAVMVEKQHEKKATP